MVAYKRLKNKGKVKLGKRKSGRGRLRELFITKFKSQLKWGFAKVVATRAGRYKSGRRESFDCRNKKTSEGMHQIVIPI